MNIPSKFISCVIGATLVLGGSTHANGSKLAADLEQTWKSKTLTLRVPDPSEHLKFNMQGERVGGTKQGIWATDAALQVQSVTLDGQRLRIKGKRVVNYFDWKTGKFGEGITKENVTVELEVRDAQVTAEQLRPVLEKILLTGSEKLTDLAPPYWHACLKGKIVRRESGWRCEGPQQKPVLGGIASDLSQRGIFNVGQGVTAPQALITPDPEYTELAKKMRLQGTVILWLVIDPEGRPRDVQIVSPLGMGLEDQAVRTVQRWKFQPAMRKGVPVAVQVNVEVNFRLY